MTAKPQAPASARNSRPILAVIRYEFRDFKSVFEIGSGTGQHAVSFAEAMPWLTWQTSDLGENHKGIRSWTSDSGLANVLDPGACACAGNVANIGADQSSVPIPVGPGNGPGCRSRGPGIFDIHGSPNDTGTAFGPRLQGPRASADAVPEHTLTLTDREHSFS